LGEEVLAMPTAITEHEPDAARPTPLPDTRFPHERLDCHLVARQVVALVARHRARLRGLPGQAGPQLERAAVPTQLNIAQAAGRQGARDRARLFAIARGEARQAAAALEVAVLFGAVSAEAAALRALLVRLGQMLTRLARPA
jgi:four helix bundle protein